MGAGVGAPVPELSRPTLSAAREMSPFLSDSSPLVWGMVGVYLLGKGILGLLVRGGGCFFVGGWARAWKDVRL